MHHWSDLSIAPAAPQLVLAALLFIVLLIDLWLSDRQRWITHVLSIATIVVTAVVQWAVWTTEPRLAFFDMFLLDGLSQTANMMIYGLMVLVLLYSRSYIQARGLYQGEFYTLSLFALLGMTVMVSTTHFLVLYVGLEILALSMYALIALNRDHDQSLEAAFKYFILGALASGFLLYGVSLIYGSTGALDLGKILQASIDNKDYVWLLRLGVVFVVAALAFKMGAVPFHMWVPDVYQGAPIATVALIGTAVKVAATVFVMRILAGGLSGVVTAGLADWVSMVHLLAAASLIVGNLAAMVQTNLKRVLAYSTISHMGFVLFAITTGPLGLAVALYYAGIYALTSLAAFAVLMLLSSHDVECERIEDLAGLHRRRPGLAFLMLLVLFSMAGIPPLVGFYAKFTVIHALVGVGFFWQAVLAVLMSVVGAFYYIRLVKVMYFDNPIDDKDVTISFSRPLRFLLGFHVLLLLALGLSPETILQWSLQALQAS